MLASQDIALPEPGVCIDDFRCLRKPVHRACWDDSPHLFLRTAIALNPSQTPEAYTRHLHANSRVSQLPVIQSGGFMLLGAVYAVARAPEILLVCICPL